MNLRQIRDRDLPALAELCRAGLREPVAPGALERLLLAEPGRTPAYELGLWEGPELVAAALGGVRRRPEGPVGGVRLLVVAPGRRRRGLASRLLDELEGAMAAAGLAELRFGGLAPNYLWPGVDVRDTPAICMLERRGYQRFGEAHNMDVDLLSSRWESAADEGRLAAAGWQLRRADPADGPALLGWVAAAFSPAWAWEAEQAMASRPVSCHIALREGQVGGFACYDVSGPGSCFGPTGADPQARGLGLGRALLLRCLADMRARGDARAEIGWVGPIAFYSHVAGARIGRVCWLMRRGLAARGA